MSVFEAIAIATVFGVLTSMVRFAVLAWMPDTSTAEFFRKTIR